MSAYWRQLRIRGAGCAIALAGFMSLTQPATVCQAGEKYAIVVGVNECPNFRLPGGAKPRPLAGAEQDAAAVAELLRKSFGDSAANVQLLTGKHATCAAVNEALDAVARSAHADDQVVFYFSGHGTQIADAQPGDESDELDEALCLYDAEATGRNLLVDDALGRWLDRLPTRHATVLLDCCHAGTGTKELGDDNVPRFLPSAIPPAEAPANRSGVAATDWIELRGSQKSLDRRRTALFACQPAQQAYERRLRGLKPGERRGQFSYYLVEGLTDRRADQNHDGIVTTAEVLHYIKEQIDQSFNKQRSRTADQQQPAVEADAPDEPLFGSTE